MEVIILLKLNLQITRRCSFLDFSFITTFHCHRSLNKVCSCWSSNSVKRKEIDTLSILALDSVESRILCIGGQSDGS